jgi:magnesium chelatase family protein
MAEEARQQGAEGIAVAAENAREAALVDGLSVVPLRSLRELEALAAGGLKPLRGEDPPSCENGARAREPDLADLRGQPGLRRALEVAAAGGHSLLMVGPPGAGKSLACRRLPGLLPPISRAEAVEVTRIASACGHPPPPGRLAGRPFRAPHHTISSAGLVGGGTPPRPGEVTAAHRGVLFLDELAEFSRSSLEALRQPLEEGRVAIVRAGHRLELPCRFMLVAASNPCPCGLGRDAPGCRCDESAVRRYEAKLSGALADRIDLVLAVAQPTPEAMASGDGVPTAVVRERVIGARERQQQRLGEGRCNAEMTAAETQRACELEPEATELLAASHSRLGLSGRGYERVLRVARTIADLAGAERTSAAHVGEALSLRRRSAGG